MKYKVNTSRNGWYPCPYPDCKQQFMTSDGLSKHKALFHKEHDETYRLSLPTKIVDVIGTSLHQGPPSTGPTIPWESIRERRTYDLHTNAEISRQRVDGNMRKYKSLQDKPLPTVNGQSVLRDTRTVLYYEPMALTEAQRQTASGKRLALTVDPKTARDSDLPDGSSSKDK